MTSRQASTLFSIVAAAVMTVVMLAGVDGLATGEAAGAAMSAKAVAGTAKA